MSARRHPSDAALASYAGGTLDEARRLVVAAHLAICAQCRVAVSAFEATGGVILDDLEPTPLRQGARGAILEKLAAPFAHEPRPGNDEFAGPLAAYELGPWRWLGRGISWRRVDIPEAGNMRAFMLKAAPGTRLPHHKHQGAEWTCVLQGAYRHDDGIYGPADFDEADETIEHRPVVEAGDECICLVALEGQIALQGWVGRLLQPLIRF